MNRDQHIEQRGVTMVELIIVICIVAILMAIAAPSYKYVTTANRVSSEVNGLLGDLQFARAEAIKEGQTITVCATTNGASCAAAGTPWTGGWLVFTGAAPTANGLLRIQKPLSSGDQLTGNNNVSAVSFSREGFAASLPTGATLTLQDSTANIAYTRCLNITLVGAMTTQVHGQGTC